MVHLMELDRIGSPSYDSLVFGETLIGNSSNSPACFSNRCNDTGDQFQSTAFQEEAKGVDVEFEGTMDLEGGKSLEFSSMGYSSSDLIKPNVVGPGFTNLGNTCFLNAVLQCLTHTVPLIQSLQSAGHVKSCECYNEEFCLTCALLYHIDDAIAGVGIVVPPWKLVRNLRYFSTDFDRFQQEDAHEFLQCLLDRLDSRVYSKVGSFNGKSIVKQIFGGSLVSRVQCCNCGHYSDTFEPMIDLSIEIGSTNNLLDALESFTDVEIIRADDGTRFTCENCMEVVSIKKKFELENAPSIASFHLKRFKNDGSLVDKIDKHVDFPLELDLSPYTRNPNMDLKYYLYAIVVHQGTSSSSGHYYSCVQFSPKEWYNMDDSRVTRVKEEDVLSEEAYILFYAKMETPSFSSLMRPETQSLATNTSPTSVLDCVCSSLSGMPMINTMTEDTTYDDSEVPEDKADDAIQNLDVNKMETDPSSVMNETSFKSNVVDLEDKLKENDKFSTPVRPSSPDVYVDKNPPVKKTSASKRQMEHYHEEDSSERKQARRLVKSMPNQRGKQLLGLLNKSNKKSPQGRVSTPLFVP